MYLKSKPHNNPVRMWPLNPTSSLAQHYHSKRAKKTEVIYKTMLWTLRIKQGLIFLNRKLDSKFSHTDPVRKRQLNPTSTLAQHSHSKRVPRLPPLARNSLFSKHRLACLRLFSKASVPQLTWPGDRIWASQKKQIWAWDKKPSLMNQFWAWDRRAISKKQIWPWDRKRVSEGLYVGKRQKVAMHAYSKYIIAKIHF